MFPMVGAICISLSVNCLVIVLAHFSRRLLFFSPSLRSSSKIRDLNPLSVIKVQIFSQLVICPICLLSYSFFFSVSSHRTLGIPSCEQGGPEGLSHQVPKIDSPILDTCPSAPSCAVLSAPGPLSCHPETTLLHPALLRPSVSPSLGSVRARDELTISVSPTPHTPDTWWVREGMNGRRNLERVRQPLSLGSPVTGTLREQRVFAPQT